MDQEGQGFPGQEGSQSVRKALGSMGLVSPAVDRRLGLDMWPKTTISLLLVRHAVLHEQLRLASLFMLFCCHQQTTPTVAVTRDVACQGDNQVGERCS